MKSSSENAYSTLFFLHFTGGDVFSWGLNSHGQLGLGKEVPRQHTPVLVCALTGVAVTQVSAGASHSLFLTLPGLVYCCGANKYGQLGVNRVDENGTNTLLYSVTNSLAHILKAAYCLCKWSSLVVVRPILHMSICTTYRRRE